MIICEDEPYYCLYTGEWKPQSQPAIKNPVETLEGKQGQEAFINALPPTFLRFDTEGRVIRMDVSKLLRSRADVRPFRKRRALVLVLAGSLARLFSSERLTRATEASTQAPSGFVTAMTATMLQKDGFDGYIRWLRGIKAMYNMRKTWLCDTFEDVFHLEFDDSIDKSNVAVRDIFGGTRGVTCYAKEPSKPSTSLEKQVSALNRTSTPLVSFIPPTGKFHLGYSC